MLQQMNRNSSKHRIKTQHFKQIYILNCCIQMGNRNHRQQQLLMYSPPLGEYALLEYVQPLAIWKHNSKNQQIMEFKEKINDSYDLDQKIKIFKERYQHHYLVSSAFLQIDDDFSHCSTAYSLRIFYERVLTNFSKIKDIPFNDTLHCYTIAFKGFQILFRMFGYFQIYENMFHICQNGKLKVWCNKNIHLNHPESYLIDKNGTQQDMIIRIINIIDDNSEKGSENNSIKHALFSGKHMNFVQVIQTLRQICRINKFRIPQKLQSLTNTKNTQIQSALDIYLPKNQKIELFPQGQMTFFPKQQQNLKSSRAKVEKLQNFRSNSNLSSSRARKAQPQETTVPIRPKSLNLYESAQNQITTPIKMVQPQSQKQIVSAHPIINSHQTINYSPVKRIVPAPIQTATPIYICPQRVNLLQFKKETPNPQKILKKQVFSFPQQSFQSFKPAPTSPPTPIYNPIQNQRSNHHINQQLQNSQLIKIFPQKQQTASFQPSPIIQFLRNPSPSPKINHSPQPLMSPSVEKLRPKSELANMTGRSQQSDSDRTQKIIPTPLPNYRNNPEIKIIKSSKQPPIKFNQIIQKQTEEINSKHNLPIIQQPQYYERLPQFDTKINMLDSIAESHRQSNEMHNPFGNYYLKQSKQLKEKSESSKRDSVSSAFNTVMKTMHENKELTDPSFMEKLRSSKCKYLPREYVHSKEGSNYSNKSRNQDFSIETSKVQSISPKVHKSSYFGFQEMKRDAQFSSYLKKQFNFTHKINQPSSLESKQELKINSNTSLDQYSKPTIYQNIKHHQTKVEPLSSQFSTITQTSEEDHTSTGFYKKKTYKPHIDEQILADLRKLHSKTNFPSKQYL